MTGISRERVGAPSGSIAVQIRTRIGAATIQGPYCRRMPTRTAETRTHRAMNLVLAEDLVQHLDRQARRRGCSRSAYIRYLMLRDQEQTQKAATRAA